MTRQRMILGTVALAGLSTVGAAGRAHAGTPLICHANDIGTAASLPWGAGAPGEWNTPRADYAPDRLIPDTLALLTAKTPVLVRMETMRRATLYARGFSEKGRPDVGPELLARLQARVLDAELKGGAGDPLAWFDAGYFAGSLEQWSTTKANGRYAGYDWVVKALRARNGDPEIELAAALMKLEPSTTPDGHWARAKAGSKNDPLLAKNIESRLRR